MSLYIQFKVAVDNMTDSISDLTAAMLAKVNWLYIRLIFIAVGVFPLLLAASNEAQEAQPIMWSFIPVVLLFGIIGLQIIIGLQVYNRMSAKVWLRPAWKHNPFNLKQPLQFFHLVGWFMLVGSLSYLPAILEGNEESIFLAAILASFGFGLLLGVRLSVLIYRQKFTDTE